MRQDVAAFWFSRGDRWHLGWRQTIDREQARERITSFAAIVLSIIKVFEPKRPGPDVSFVRKGLKE
jgi:hypothetical protein